jgi:hypothetical protein
LRAKTALYEHFISGAAVRLAGKNFLLILAQTFMDYELAIGME